MRRELLMTFKEELFNLLNEDEEFRKELTDKLGISEIYKEIRNLNVRFNEMLDEIRKHTLILREHARIVSEQLKRLEEHDRKFNEILEELREHRRILDEHTKRLEEHDRKFNEILEEIKNIKISQAEMSGRIEALSRTYYSISSTLGDLVEDWLLTKFEEELRREGLNLKEMRRITVDGREIDAILRDDEAVVVEVSSTVKAADVLKIDEEAELISKMLRRNVRKVILGMKADKKAIDLAKGKGVEIKVRFGVPASP